MNECRQLFILGVCNFAYNLASQLVLANVAVVSHGMLELFKRIFVLVSASILLQVWCSACQRITNMLCKDKVERHYHGVCAILF